MPNAKAEQRGPLTCAEQREVEKLSKLIPGAVEEAGRLMREATHVLRKNPETGELYKDTTELGDELTGIAHEMLIEQYPKVNVEIIKKYLPRRLKDYWIDHRHAVEPAVKAATNRKRCQRQREYLVKNCTLRDPREGRNGMPVGPAYQSQACLALEDLLAVRDTSLMKVFGEDGNFNACGLIFPNGKYAPDFFGIRKGELKRVIDTYQFLHDYIAVNDTERAIVKYLQEQFDPEHPAIFLELERVSNLQIAKAVNVSPSTVSRRLNAMKERLRRQLPEIKFKPTL